MFLVPNSIPDSLEAALFYVNNFTLFTYLLIYYRPDSNHTLNVTTSTAFLGMRRWGIRIVRVMGVGGVGMGGSVFEEEEQPMRLAGFGLS